jgi:hypothetical protein
VLEVLCLDFFPNLPVGIDLKLGIPDEQQEQQEQQLAQQSVGRHSHE